MIKALKPYTTIQGCHPLGWNFHTGCYGDMEGCVGSLQNVFGLFTFVHGNFSGLSGDVSPLQGKVSNISGAIHISGKCNRIRGDISGHGGRLFYGDVSHLAGDCTGVFGCATGKQGDLSACGLTDEDRAAGVNIEDLVME
jgi:hypothetical protein